MAKATAKTTKAPAAKKAAVKATPAKKTATKAAAPKAAKPAAEKKAAVKAAPKAAPKTSKKVAVVFEANCPLATTVSVAGSFNNWAIDKDMLKKDKKTGLWVGKVTLDSGVYEYKFVCDGQYWDEGDNKIKHV